MAKSGRRRKVVIGTIGFSTIAVVIIAFGLFGQGRNDRLAIQQRLARQLVTVALKEASLISDAKEKTSAYCQIADAQARVADAAGARQSVDEAKEVVKQISDGSDQANAYCQIAKAQVKVGDIAGAKATAEQISDERGRGRRLTVRSPVAQAKAGDMKGAYDSLKKSIAPATSTFYDDIASSADDMAYIQAAAGDAKAANRAKAIKTGAAEIAAKHEKSSAYCDIAFAQAEAGDIPGAKATVEQISEERDKALAYRDIASAQAKAGDVAGAKATAEQISDENARVGPYCRIAEAQAQAGDRAGARQTLEKAKVIAEQISKERDKASAYQDIAEAQAKAGDVAGAKATAEQISDENARVWPYCCIAEAQAQAGDTAGALTKPWKRPRPWRSRSARRTPGWGPTAASPKPKPRQGSTAGVRQTLEKAKAMAEQISEGETKASACRYIAEAQAKAGDVTGAIDFVASVIHSPNERCEVLASVALELCPPLPIAQAKAAKVAGPTQEESAKVSVGPEQPATTSKIHSSDDGQVRSSFPSRPAGGKSLDDLFNENDGPSDFTQERWTTFKKKLYNDGCLGHVEDSEGFRFKYPPDRYLSVFRAMRDVFEDNGFSNPSANQIYNGAKFFLGGQLDPEKAVSLRTTGNLAKRGGTPLMSREDFNTLENK